MTLEAVRVPLEAVLDLRERYREEMNCQIVHDSWHTRGFTESYHLLIGDEVVGYGSVGGAPREPKDTVKEFYLVPRYRAQALALFRRLVESSAAASIEAQTNDALLSLMLYDFAVDVACGPVLFSDGLETNHTIPGATIRRVTDADRATVFAHALEPVGEWGVECDGELVATGGLKFHYNPPYGDLYMEVDRSKRRRGFGTFIVQELKRICREGGRVPAARCRAENVASRRALERAGMFPCARILRGRIAPADSTEYAAYTD